MQENQELQIRLRELEKEVARLHAQIKAQKYGLTWLDVPESFDKDSENKIPILEEVKERAIDVRTEKDSPQHILIEGDNYHALTCLNYTHRGKIDVIYIDPPYNTGSDGFTYKDKRFLTEFPDGTSVPREHPFRHSYWLSFMSKRLELAKNLLSDKGVIFISIDDNEQANLKLLCDKVFGDDNFVGQWNWFKSATPPNLSYKIKKNVEYILAYEKQRNNTVYRGVQKISKSDDPMTKPQNSLKILSFPPKTINVKIKDCIIKKGIYGTSKFPNELLDNMIVQNVTNKNAVSFKNMFIWLQEKLNEEISNNTIINCSKSLVLSYKKQNYAPEVPPNLIDISVGVDTTEEAGKQLDKIFEKKVFNYPKPVSLIEYLIKFKDNATILDFFAGSGTTLHATLKLNAEDGGTRQCILVQQAEGENNICQNVTYERNRRVMCGYTNARGEQVAGIGGALKYYKTAFVGKHEPREASDEDKVLLSQKAGCLLALGENTLNEMETTAHYQIFSDGNNNYTGVYFSGDTAQMAEFTQKLETLRNASRRVQIVAYFFSWDDGEQFSNEFISVRQIKIKTIPQPILEIYKSLNQ